jgi:hypothetical protein
LANALDQFAERPPRDLPDGLLDKVGDIRSSLDEFHPETDSPGRQAARIAAGGGAEPEPKKPEPSPGKKAADVAFAAAAERAASKGEGEKQLAESIAGGGAGASRGD